MPPALTFERVLCRPPMATELLAKNINRNMPAIHAERFAKIILLKDWVEDANPIRIDKEGYVRDGQSRLSGVALAGEYMDTLGRAGIAAKYGRDVKDVVTQVAVPMLIVRGVEPEAQLVMDTGRKRSFAHFLQIKGVGDAAALQGITTLLWNYENHVLDTRSSWTMRTSVPHMDLWHLYQAKTDEIKTASRIAHGLRRTAMINLSVGAVGWLIFSGIDDGDAIEFFAQLRMEHEVKPGTGPALVLRLFNGMRPREYDQQEQLAFLIKGWNIFRDGAIRELIMWRPGGRHHEAFPVPR